MVLFPLNPPPPPNNRMNYEADFDKQKLTNRNKRTMTVLYRSPDYYAVKVDNEDKYQIPKFKAK